MLCNARLAGVTCSNTVSTTADDRDDAFDPPFPEQAMKFVLAKKRPRGGALNISCKEFNFLSSKHKL
jgi:hypothetical protein